MCLIILDGNSNRFKRTVEIYYGLLGAKRWDLLSKGDRCGKGERAMPRGQRQLICKSTHKATLHIVICVYRGSHDDHDDGYLAHGESLGHF